MHGRARLAGAGLAVAAVAMVVVASPARGAGILPIDTGCVPLPDAYVTTMGMELDVSIAAGVLANDIDVDGDQLKSRDGTQPGHGDLNLDNEGSFRYRPDPGYVGTDTFKYVCDDGTVKVAALVTIAILPLATPTPAPTKPPPTPKATPTPTPAATPIPLPSILPSLSPLPTILPTRPPTATPTPSVVPTPSADPSVTPAPRGTPGSSPTSTSAPRGGSPSPGAGGTGAGGGSPRPLSTPQASKGPGATQAAPAWLTIPGGGGTGGGSAEQPVELAGAPIAFSAGVFAWAVPGAVLAVPGLLVLLAVGLQVLAGAVWLPVARRRLGAFGFRRRD